MLSTGLLQIDCPNLLSTICCKFFQQVVTSLQITNCNKPDFGRLVANWWDWKALKQLVDKLLQFGKTDNLQQVCGNFDCVNEEYKQHVIVPLIHSCYWVLVLCQPFLIPYFVFCRVCQDGVIWLEFHHQ